MVTNEVVERARRLDENSDCTSVIELLRDYIGEKPNDKIAYALYMKNLMRKSMLDYDVDLEKIFVSEEIYVYDDVPSDKRIGLSEMIFVEAVSSIYLSDYPDDKKSLLVCVYLKRIIASLGEQLNDFSALKSLLDKMYKALIPYKFEKDFWSHLVSIVDWRSKTSVNIVLYLAEKAKGCLNVSDDENIYNDYIKEITITSYLYKNKPTLQYKGGLNRSIEKQEEKDFWEGYFAKVKQVCEKECEEYKKIISDETHELHEIYIIGDYIHNSYTDNVINKLTNGLLTKEEIIRFEMETDWREIEESKEIIGSYNQRIVQAEKLINELNATNQTTVNKNKVNKSDDNKSKYNVYSYISLGISVFFLLGAFVGVDESTAHTLPIILGISAVGAIGFVLLKFKPEWIERLVNKFTKR